MGFDEAGSSSFDFEGWDRKWPFRIFARNLLGDSPRTPNRGWLFFVFWGDSNSPAENQQEQVFSIETTIGGGVFGGVTSKSPAENQQVFSIETVEGKEGPFEHVALCFNESQAF